MKEKVLEVKDCRDCEHFYDKYPRNKGYCDLSKDRIDWCFGYDVPSDCPLEDKE